MKKTTILTVGSLLLMLSACAGMPGTPAAPAMVSDGVLTGSNGMTLYTFDKDAGGKSMCNGECAKNWPPLMVKKDDEAPKDKWTHVTRDDGSMQWAYDGKPLYTFVKDKKAGETTGDGVKDVWHVAKP